MRKFPINLTGQLRHLILEDERIFTRSEAPVCLKADAIGNGALKIFHHSGAMKNNV